MTKFRILFAALAVIAAAGLVNCSKMKANHSTPAGGPVLESETPQGETEEQKAQRLFREKIEYRASVSNDLKKMTSSAYGADKCQTSERDDLKNTAITSPLAGERDEQIRPAEFVMSTDSDISILKVNAVRLSEILDAAGNKHCAVNVGADVAQFALDNFMLNNSIELDDISSEDYDALVSKAAQVVEKLKPTMDKLIYAINTAERDESIVNNVVKHEALTEAVKTQVSKNEAEVEKLRGYYHASCLEADTADQCPKLDRGMVNANVFTLAALKNANSVLESSKLMGENDPQMEAKLANLENALEKLQHRMEVASNLTRMHQANKIVTDENAQQTSDEFAAQDQAGEEQVAQSNGPQDAIDGATYVQAQEAQARLETKQAELINECESDHGGCTQTQIHNILNQTDAI